MGSPDHAPPPPGFNVHGGESHSSYSRHKNDSEYGAMDEFAFSDKTIRAGFIRKVYSILMCQLIVTLVFVSWFTFDKRTQKWVSENPFLLWISLIGVIVLTVVLCCFTEIRRKTPWNYILLFAYTLMQSYLVGAIAGTYKAEAVVLSIGITTIICLGLTVFAFQTKWDFTGCGPFLFVLSLVLFLFGLTAIFWKGRTIHLLYGALGVLLFSFYLIYDTQMMMGGNHKYSISPEEYIFAALSIYVDIINIFLYILSLFGNSS